MPQQTPDFIPAQPQKGAQAPPSGGVPDFIPAQGSAPKSVQQGTPDFIPHQPSFEERVQPTQGGPPQQKPFNFHPQMAPPGYNPEAPENQQPYPEWFQRALEDNYLNAVAPFDKMGEAGVQAGRNTMRDLTTTLLHPMQTLRGAHHGGGLTPQTVGQTTLEHPTLMGAAQAVGGLYGGTATDPRQWPLMAGQFASPALRSLTSAGFGGQMAYGAGSQAAQLGAHWDTLTPEQKSEMITSGTLQAILAGFSGGHAFTEGAKAMKPYETGAQARVSPGADPRTGAPPSATGNVPPSPQQQPITIDPALQAIAAMRNKANFAKEGAAKPSSTAAAQMGGAEVAQPKASMAPSETTPIERRVSSGQPPTGTPERRAATLPLKGVQGPPPEQNRLISEAQKQVDAAQTVQEKTAALNRLKSLKGTTAGLDIAAQGGEKMAADIRSAREKSSGQPISKEAAEAADRQRRGQSPAPIRQPLQQRANLAQPFDLPKRPIDNTKAFPDRTRGQEPKDFDSLIKRQVSEGKLTKGEAAKVLAKKYDQARSPELGPGFRWSDLTPVEQQRFMESSVAKQATKPQGTPTAPPSATSTAAPKSVQQPAKESVREAGTGVVETPSKTPEKAPSNPVEPQSGSDWLLSQAKSDKRITTALTTIAKKLRELPEQMQGSAKKVALEEMANHLKAGSNPTQAADRALGLIAQYHKQGGFLGGGKKGVAAGGVKLEDERPEGSIGSRIEEEYNKLKASRKLDQQLFDLQSQQVGDMLEGRKNVEGMSDAKHHREIYHAIESGDNSNLTPEQKEIAKNEVKPILEESKKEIARLKDLDIPTKEYENYMHRVAAKKGSKLEMALLGRKSYSPGAVLSKAASGLKKSSYGVAESPAGRVVVSVKGDKVQAWHKGQATPVGSKEELEGLGWVFSRGTTKEITPATGQKYFEHAGINSQLNLLELKRVRRAAEALELYKSSPEFKEFAQETGKGNPPKGWKTTGVPQLRGYSFEPHTAEVLDRYWKRVQGGDSNAFEYLNNFLRTSIFFNPLIHVPNIANHWFVEKGVSGFGPQAWPRVAKTSWMAIRDVLTQSDRFRIAHEFGTPFQSSKIDNRKFTSLLYTKMVKELSENPSMAEKVAQGLGYANPARLIKGLYNFSSKVTWVSQDIAFLQATYDRMYRGNNPFSANYTKIVVPFDHAMREVGKHIPNYQLPTRIFNTKAIADLMSNPALSMFGAYHYGALKSYFEISKEMFHPSLPIQERAKALDRVAALALSMYALYWAQDKLQKHFKDPNLKIRFPGAATVPHNIIEVAKGRKGLTTAAEATVTPAPLAKIAGETIASAGKEGKLPLGEQAKKIGGRVAESVGPVQAYQRAQSAGQKGFDWQTFLLNMLGVYKGAPNTGNSAPIKHSRSSLSRKLKFK